MSNLTRLAVCALLGGCASAPPGSNAGCEPDDGAAGFPGVLLRPGCDERLESGRADWQVADGVVTLQFDAALPGARGGELVAAWPPLDQPPWLGHQVDGIVVSGDRVSVAFRDPHPDVARVFADPRLAVPVTVVTDHDVRDAIDRDERGIFTRHAASIEYARSVGLPVRLAAFDRAYLVALAVTSEVAEADKLAAALGADWVRRAPTGTRRPSSRSWNEISAACLPAGGGRPRDSAAADATAPAGAADGANPSVSYPEGDLAARQIAERLAAMALRGGAAAVLAELTGARGRLTVRAAPAADPGRDPGDVAVVVPVPAGPVHPCSLFAETARKLAGWGVGDPGSGAAVLMIGEAGAFAVGRAARDLP